MGKAIIAHGSQSEVSAMKKELIVSYKASDWSKKDSHSSGVTHRLTPNKIYTSADNNDEFNNSITLTPLTNFTSKKYIVYYLNAVNLSINVSNPDKNFNSGYGALTFKYEELKNNVAVTTDDENTTSISLFYNNDRSEIVHNETIQNQAYILYSEIGSFGLSLRIKRTRMFNMNFIINIYGIGEYL